MSVVIEQPRHFCALGAQQTVLAIERAVPIIHAGPGCSSKLFGGLSFCNGYQGSGFAGGSAIPCTNATEKEVVFGGEQRLEELIEETLRVMDGDLFVVLTGCTSDIVGDDVGRVAREFRDRGLPVAYAETGGFKGSSYLGHELVVQAIIEQILEPAADAVNEKLVNIWSVVPYLDPFWSGNLEEIKNIVEGLGLEANILFGPGSGGIEAWRRIPSASCNILLSPWVGLKTVQLLKESFGTPYLHYPVLPIGASETSRFLRILSETLELDESRVEDYIARQEAYFYHYLERAADFLLEFRYDLPGRFFVISDSFYALGVSRFLVNDLGLLPGHQFITDDTPEEHQQKIIAEFERLGPKVSSGVTFSPDGGQIKKELREFNHQFQPLIIGSTWDKDIASELNGFQLSLGLPVTDRLVLDRSYVGYRGGLRLTEDIYAAVLGSYQ